MGLANGRSAIGAWSEFVAHCFLPVYASSADDAAPKFGAVITARVLGPTANAT
jgi:hypothetical protein